MARANALVLLALDSSTSIVAYHRLVAPRNKPNWLRGFQGLAAVCYNTPMQLEHSQAGDITIRDIAETLYNVHMDVRHDTELLQHLVSRVDALEHSTRRGAHIVGLNVLALVVVAMMLLRIRRLSE